MFMFTAWKVKGWFQNQRTEYGRLKKNQGKSGQAPSKMSKRASWRWNELAYLHDHIVGRTYSQETDPKEVGICINLLSCYGSSSYGSSSSCLIRPPYSLLLLLMEVQGLTHHVFLPSLLCVGSILCTLVFCICLGWRGVAQ